jgi:hypothetical protein
MRYRPSLRGLSAFLPKRSVLVSLVGQRSLPLHSRTPRFGPGQPPSRPPGHQAAPGRPRVAAPPYDFESAASAGRARMCAENAARTAVFAHVRCGDLLPSPSPPRLLAAGRGASLWRVAVPPLWRVPAARHPSGLGRQAVSRVRRWQDRRREWAAARLLARPDGAANMTFTSVNEHDIRVSE